MLDAQHLARELPDDERWAEASAVEQLRHQRESGRDEGQHEAIGGGLLATPAGEIYGGRVGRGGRRLLSTS